MRKSASLDEIDHRIAKYVTTPAIANTSLMVKVSVASTKELSSSLIRLVGIVHLAGQPHSKRDARLPDRRNS